MWEILIAAGPVMVLLAFLPETSAITILHRRASRLRRITEHDNIRSSAELAQANISVGAVVFESLLMPVKISFQDPAILFAHVYTSLTYGIYYSFFEAFPITSTYRKRNSTRSGTEFLTFYLDLDLVLATIIQSLSLSCILSSISSSLSSSISRVVALVVRLFLAFPFDISTSAFSTSSRISFVLKTNFPLIATRFPFLRSLRTLNSSLNLAFSFRKRVFSEVVLSKATPDRSIYYFTGVSIVEERTILLTSNVASRSSVPSGGELSSRERSRSFGVVIGSGVTYGVGVGIRRVERIVIGLSG
jgi:hypothetical protein